jgi:hypothetical protein
LGLFLRHLHARHLVLLRRRRGRWLLLGRLHAGHVLNLLSLLIVRTRTALVPLLLLFGSLRQDLTAFLCQTIDIQALRKGRTVVSGAEAFAGSSPVSGGGGAVAQPARRPKASNGTEYRFILCPGDRFRSWNRRFHSAEMPDLGSLDSVSAIAEESKRSTI